MSNNKKITELPDATLPLSGTEIMPIVQSDGGTMVTKRVSVFAFTDAIGLSGFSGKSGFSGYSGYSGRSGYSGQSGLNGIGDSGYSGYSGRSGYSGYSGKSGYSGLDATNSMFLQSGTGAVARTVQNKLRDGVSVKDFGAVGDGTTDDTAKIQAAIDAHQKRIIYFPTGTYAITGIKVYPQQTLIFESKAVLKMTANGIAIRTAVSPAKTKPSYYEGIHGILIENATINMNNKTGIGILLERAYLCAVSDSNILNVSSSTYSYQDSFEDSAHNYPSAGIIIKSVGHGTASRNVINNTRINGNKDTINTATNAGIWIGSSQETFLELKFTSIIGLISRGDTVTQPIVGQLTPATGEVLSFDQTGQRLFVKHTGGVLFVDNIDVTITGKGTGTKKGTGTGTKVYNIYGACHRNELYNVSVEGVATGINLVRSNNGKLHHPLCQYCKTGVRVASFSDTDRYRLLANVLSEVAVSLCSTGVQIEKSAIYTNINVYSTTWRTTTQIIDNGINTAFYPQSSYFQESVRFYRNAVRFPPAPANLVDVDRDPNALDAYREGSFTPTLAFGETVSDNDVPPLYDAQSGRFTRIGNIVHFYIYLNLKDTLGDTTGTAYISGLPYSPRYATVLNANLQSGFTNLTGTPLAVMSTVGGNIQLKQTTSSGTSNITNANFTVNAVLYISGTYHVKYDYTVANPEIGDELAEVPEIFTSADSPEILDVVTYELNDEFSLDNVDFLG